MEQSVKSARKKGKSRTKAWRKYPPTLPTRRKFPSLVLATGRDPVSKSKWLRGSSGLSRHSVQVTPYTYRSDAKLRARKGIRGIAKIDRDAARRRRQSTRGMSPLELEMSRDEFRWGKGTRRRGERRGGRRGEVMPGIDLTGGDASCCILWPAPSASPLRAGGGALGCY
jgi:hypothetical protein